MTLNLIPITAKGLHLQMPSHQPLGLQYKNWRGAGGEGETIQCTAQCYSQLLHSKLPTFSGLMLWKFISHIYKIQLEVGCGSHRSLGSEPSLTADSQGRLRMHHPVSRKEERSSSCMGGFSWPILEIIHINSIHIALARTQSCGLT